MESGQLSESISHELQQLAEQIREVNDFQKALESVYADKKPNWGRLKITTEFTLLLLNKFPNDALTIIDMFCKAHDKVIQQSKSWQSEN